MTQVGRADPPLAKAIAEAHRLAGQQVRRSEKLNGLYFEEVPEYPDFAWQEAIVNAFAHRDYEYQGREVEAWFYEDRMEVSSPGDLLPPVTLARLREGLPAHATRNPLIVRVLADAGVMREGEGVARIFEEMAESSLREPEVELEDGVFCVRLYKRAGLPRGRMLPPEPPNSPALVQRACVNISFGTPATPTTAGSSGSAAIPPPASCGDSSRGGLLRMEGKGRGARYLPEASLDVPGNRAK